MTQIVEVTSSVNNVFVSSPGPQGVRGKTILNGNGAPANNLGLEGDFYYDKSSSRFYGPKLSDTTWTGADNYLLNTTPAFVYNWELGSLSQEIPGVYSITITHNLGFYPNVTVKSTAGQFLETELEYNNINQITLSMAQPFSGTAYLS